MQKNILLLLLLLNTAIAIAQTNVVTYAGSSGKETFYDVMQITDGTFLVCGSNFVIQSAPPF